MKWLLQPLGLASAIALATGCSTVPTGSSVIPDSVWSEPDRILASPEPLEVGDILIPEQRGRVPHVLMVSENGRVVSFWPNSGYVPWPLSGYLRELSRREQPVAVLRLRNKPDGFEKALIREAARIRHKSYGISPKKEDDHALYCSQFIWLVYKRAGLASGREIDIDSNGGALVKPYEILRSGELESLRFQPPGDADL